MVPCLSIDTILNLANKISSNLAFDKRITSINDIDIVFFEDVLRNLSDFEANDHNSTLERYERCIEWLENLTNVQLYHITSKDLLDAKLPSVHNFLEILWFLVDYATLESSHTGGLTSSTDEERQKPSLASCSATTYEREFTAVELAPSDGESNSPANRTIKSDHHDIKRDNIYRKMDCINSTTAQCITNREKERFLREKLLQCLTSINVGNCNPKTKSSRYTSNMVAQRHSPKQLKFNSIGSTLKHSKSSTGLIKPCDHLLAVTNRSVAKFRPVTPNENQSNSLIEDLLESFPSLKIDDHDIRILNKKLADGLCQAVPTTSHFDRRLTWIEERQKRRLAQLLRHELRADRILNRNYDASTTDRVLRAKAQEQRRQLVRARNHYRQFVQEYRTRKIAKILNEERIFRHLFEHLMEQEKAQLREFHRIEREDRRYQDASIAHRNKRADETERARFASLAHFGEKCGLNVESIRQEPSVVKRRERELRSHLERSIQQLQQCFLDNQDSEYFRTLDAGRILSAYSSI